MERRLLPHHAASLLEAGCGSKSVRGAVHVAGQMRYYTQLEMRSGCRLQEDAIGALMDVRYVK